MILCCGEALIDMLPRETAGGEQAFAPYAGGSVFNTAIALGRLGAPAGYFGGLSTDLFGRLLTDTLEASRVRHDLCALSQRPTTLAFVTLTDGQAQYAFYDENTAGRMLSRDDLPPADAAQALFFGGISLVSEPAADSYADLCTGAGDVPVMVDPNVRPDFITDEPRYRTRLKAMLARADIVKMSDEDALWLGIAPESLLADGAALVVVTRGADGVDLVSPAGTTRVSATRVAVVDTVGAGDTFNAGLLAGLHRAGLLTRTGLRQADDTALAAAADLGVRAAAVTVSRAGANPPWDHEL